MNYLAGRLLEKYWSERVCGQGLS